MPFSPSNKSELTFAATESFGRPIKLKQSSSCKNNGQVHTDASDIYV